MTLLQQRLAFESAEAKGQSLHQPRRSWIGQTKMSGKVNVTIIQVLTGICLGWTAKKTKTKQASPHKYLLFWQDVPFLLLLPPVPSLRHTLKQTLCLECLAEKPWCFNSFGIKFEQNKSTELPLRQRTFYREHWAIKLGGLKRCWEITHAVTPSSPRISTTSRPHQTLGDPGVAAWEPLHADPLRFRLPLRTCSQEGWINWRRIPHTKQRLWPLGNTI